MSMTRRLVSVHLSGSGDSRPNPYRKMLIKIYKGVSLEAKIRGLKTKAKTISLWLRHWCAGSNLPVS